MLLERAIEDLHLVNEREANQRADSEAKSSRSWRFFGLGCHSTPEAYGMTCTSTTTSFLFESPEPTTDDHFSFYPPPMQALFNASISRGWISYEEINTCLPDEMLDAEEMDLLLDRLDRANVTFIDQPTVEREERDTYCRAAAVQSALQA